MPAVDTCAVGALRALGLIVQHLAERTLTIQMNVKAAHWLSEQLRHLLKTNGLQ